MPDRDLLVIGTLPRLAGAAELLKNSPIQLNGNQLNVDLGGQLDAVTWLYGDQAAQQRREAAARLSAPLSAEAAALVGTESPLRSGRSVVAMLAAAPAALDAALGTMRDSRQAPQIQGDLAILSAGHATSYRVGDTYTVGHLAPWVWPSWVLRNSPVGMLAVTIAGCVLLGLVFFRTSGDARSPARRARPGCKEPHLIPPPQRRSWRGLVLAATALAFPAMPTWAQTAGTPPSATPAAGAGAPGPGAAAPGGPEAGAGADQAVRVLLQQARYWRSQYQPERALTAINRALRLDPKNADALALLTETQSERGERGAAQSAYDQLRQVAPNDPKLGAIDQALRMGKVNEDELAQARDLARQGHAAEAVAAYQRVFHGPTPPANLAVEYYQTLSGTEGGWEQARAGLGTLVIANPQDLKAQLAYAQLLTYRDQTRAEGIERLNRLAANPPTASAAKTALRQALLWLPNQPASAPAIEAYLHADPNDSQIQQKLQAATNPPKTGPDDTVGQLRVSGWSELNHGKLNEAATQFEQALQQNPTDSDALGGLGLVRLRQGRTAEGRALLQRAIAADPSKRGNWQAALNGSNVTVEWGEVRALAARGDTAGAERLLKRLMGSSPNAGTIQLLADLQQRNGELAEAEASYRQALAMTPASGGIMAALAGVLQREGKQEEAQRLYAEAEQHGDRSLVGRARADALRQRAEEVSDPVAQAGLYRAALAQDPNNPWLRLDLARTLVKQGRMIEAQALVQEGIAGAHPSADALEAAVYFYQETGNPQLAAATIARLPARARTPQMRALQAQIDFQNQLRQATLGDRYSVRARLLAMAAAPDPNGTRGAAIARALIGIGDKQGAREAIVTAIAAARNPTPAQRIAYAGALMDAGAMGDAYQLASSVDPARLPTSEAQAAQSLRAGIAVRSADTLNEQGKQAEAYDQLAPVLERQPANPDANMALARLYESNRQPERALVINRALLQRNPADLAVRQAAVDAAIAAGNWSLANQWVHEGLQAAPSDPRAYMMAADLAKARGDRGTALRYLETARTLHLRQTGGSGAAPGLLGSAASRIQGAEPAAFVTDVPADQLPPPAAQPASSELALGSTPGTLDGVPDDLRPRAPRSPAVPAGPVEVAQLSGTAPPAALPASGGYAFQPPPPDYNPFRTSTADQDPDMPASLGGSAGGFAPRPADPLTRQLDTQIAALRTDIAPTAEAGFDVRYRSGTAGTDQLTELMAPLEATFSPGGVGRLKVQATPTYLTAGSFAGLIPIDATGVGFDVGYDWQWLKADVGTSPVGFPVTHIVGGLEVSPEVANDFRVRATIENRPVTDSVLSYAGIDNSSVTRTTWGGVQRTRAHVQLEYAPGLANFYVGGGAASLTGQHVQDNSEIEAGLGGSYAFYKTPSDEARAGLDIVYFGYQRNERFFTLGLGGYFSPQNYFAAIVPVSYSHKDSRLSWEVGASLGLQSYREAGNLVFPIDPDLQASLQNLAAITPGLATQYPSSTTTGVVGGLNGKIEYKLTPALAVGGRASYQRAGDWNEAQGLVYARYTFNGAQ